MQTHINDLADQIEWSRKIPAQNPRMHSPPRCQQHNTNSHNFFTNVDQKKDFLKHTEQSPDANFFLPNLEEFAFDTLFSVNREPFVKAQPEIEHWVDTGQPPCMVYKSTKTLKSNAITKGGLVCAQKPHRKSEGKVKSKPKSTPMHMWTCPDELEESHLITSNHNNWISEMPSNARRKSCNRNKKCKKKHALVSSSSDSNDYHELKKLIPRVLRKSMEFYDEYSKKIIKSPGNDSNEHCGTCRATSKDYKQNNGKTFRKQDDSKITQNDHPQNSQARDQYKILRKYHKKQKQPNTLSQHTTSSCDTIVLEVKKIKSKAREDSHSKKKQLNVAKGNLQPNPKSTHPRAHKHQYEQLLQTKKSRDQSPVSDEISGQSNVCDIRTEVTSKFKSNVMSNNIPKISTYLYDSDSSVLTANYIQSVRLKLNTNKKSQKILRNRIVYGSQPSNSASDQSCRKRLEIDSIYKSNSPNLVKTPSFEDNINCILKPGHHVTGERQRPVLMCHLLNEDIARKSGGIFKCSKGEEDLNLRHVGKSGKQIKVAMRTKVINDIMNPNGNVKPITVNGIMQSEEVNQCIPKSEDNEIVGNTHIQNTKATSMLAFRQITNANSVGLQTTNRLSQRMNSTPLAKSTAKGEVSFPSGYHDRLIHFTNDAIRYVQNCNFSRKGRDYTTESDSSPNIVIQIKPFKKQKSSRKPDCYGRSLNREKFKIETFQNNEEISQLCYESNPLTFYSESMDTGFCPSHV